MTDHADTIRPMTPERLEELREAAERRGRHLMSDGHYSYSTADWADVLALLGERQQAIDALRDFANPQHWAITREPDGHPRALWIGTYQQSPVEVARAALVKLGETE